MEAKTDYDVKTRRKYDSTTASTQASEDVRMDGKPDASMEEDDRLSMEDMKWVGDISGENLWKLQKEIGKAIDAIFANEPQLRAKIANDVYNAIRWSKDMSIGRVNEIASQFGIKVE